MLLGFADANLLKGNFEEARKYYQKLKVLDPENELLNNLLNKIKE